MPRLFTNSSRRSAACRKTRLQPRFESLESRELMAADFNSASIIDASGDATQETVFQDGALRVSYDLEFSQREKLDSIRVLAASGGRSIEMDTVETLQLSSGLPKSASGVLVDLSDYKELSAGDYQMQIAAETSSGDVSYSDPIAVRVLDTTQVVGSFQGEWLDVGGELARRNVGLVVHGQGGTDTMHLSKAMSQIASINGQSLKRFDPLNTDDLPIHQGYAVDHIVLENGNEIYFTGVERLEGAATSRFASSKIIELSVEPNDPEFPTQWNQHVSDVPSAWRFTTGSEDVLLVSLDSGVLPADTPEAVYGKVSDLSEGRLITDETAVDDLHFLDAKFSHGHMAISVMSSTPNNGKFVTGINWTSDVFVADVYGSSLHGEGFDLQTAIQEALAYAEQRGQKVVFQGGIQGESWLTDGGTQTELETLFSANENRAVFAVAAGNGDMEVEYVPTSYDNPKLSGGVARLQTTHPNVMAIGAMRHETATVNGMANAEDVYRAAYSNYGTALTLMGATDSPATYLFSDVEDPQFNQPNTTQAFGGTSAANPNVAGIASLVWSANVNLSGNQIRSILTDTAMNDLPNGGGVNLLTGKDYYYGHGLANADLAVRRAMALGADEALVRIDQSPRTQLFEKEKLYENEQSFETSQPRTYYSTDATADMRLPSENVETRDGEAHIRGDRQQAISNVDARASANRLASRQQMIAKLADSREARDHHQTVDEIFGSLPNDDLLDSTLARASDGLARFL